VSKKYSDNQRAGDGGETAFGQWAVNMMHWPTPTGHTRDVGTDFDCQIPGKRLSKTSVEMPGRLLQVTVRSTTQNSSNVKINRSDAELFFSSNVHRVLALVHRPTRTTPAEVAIRFPDKLFVAELCRFLETENEEHRVRFADAISDYDEIETRIETLLAQPYKYMITRLRMLYELEGVVEERGIEFVNSVDGTMICLHAISPQIEAKGLLRERIGNGPGGTPMPIVWTTSSVIPARGLSGNCSQVFPTSEVSAVTSAIETKREHALPSDIPAMAEEIRAELAIWNYDRALDIVEQIESSMKNDEEFEESSLPQLLVLLARVHVIRAERCDSDTKLHVEKATMLLDRADLISKSIPDGECTDEVRALKGAMKALESGPASGLALLSGHTDRHAIRLRVALHILNRDFDSAMTSFENIPRELHWADVAVSAYAFGGRHADAEKLVEWVRGQGDLDKYHQCVVRLADALLARALAGREEGTVLHPHDMSAEELVGLETVLKTLEPMLPPIKERIESELDLAAVRLDWQAAQLAGHREDAARLALLMNGYRPVPLEVARSVVSGIVEPPSDLPERLRLEHPNDFDACILALAIQSAHMGHYGDAFEHAELLVPLADTDKKREDLFLVLQQIWQEFDGDLLAECERIMTALVSDLPRLRMPFKAARALREGDPEMAIRSLDAEQNETDPTWLQLRANALLQKDLPGEAVEYLVSAARETSDPVLLRGAADLAFHVQKIEIARECYERLLDLQPDNVAAHKNLASIYAFHLHDLEQTSIHLQALHDAEPENSVHTVNLAICLSQLYRPKASLSLYDEACAQDTPDFRAILGRAELHLSLGDPDAALASLRGFRETAWKEPSFLMTYMNAAYVAGDEEAAQEALLALDVLRKSGGVDADAFRAIPASEGLEMLRQRAKQENEQTELIHTEMNRGRAPWIWAEAVLGNALYWGWRTRTQVMPWIPDDPVNRARFCIYATNAFHPRSKGKEPPALRPFECPPQGTCVIADMTSLFALHRLGLLDVAAGYFGEILVPEGYLPVVLEDSRKMVFHQRSRRTNLERLTKGIETGIIAVQQEDSPHDADVVLAEEYGEPKEHHYHLIDLLVPIHNAGAITDADYKRLLNVCTKESAVDDAHPALIRFQHVLVELSSLETLAGMGLLDTVVQFYKVAITSIAHLEVRHRLEAIRDQEETLAWHFDLWNQIRDDGRFTFVHGSIPDSMHAESRDEKDHLALLGCFAAQELGVPLIVDDRVCQALALNNRPDVEHPAFGTDVLVSALAANGRLDEDKAAECTHQLMQWRYRFVLPLPAMLKTLAAQYRLSPPGQALQEIAEYVHDCMRDAGLFGGPEKTALKDSMATRLYLTWVTTVVDFLVEVWNDEAFTDDSAKTLTDWAIHEFLPSPPRVSSGQDRARISAFTARQLIAQALIAATALDQDGRSADRIKAIKEALALSDDEYLRIVTEILDDR